jgi:Putative Zn-dependent protease, contains TPR repeats
MDRAEDAYRHAIALNPRLAAAWSNLGILLDARGRRKEAVAALQQAIALDPTNVGIKVNLALQYHASGLYADAKRLLDEAVRINPTLPEAQYALARTLEAMGDRSSAIQHYDLFLATANGRFPQLERQVAQHLATLRAGS